MARTQKYTEDQLVEAVVKFAEVERKKIKATELAAWCRENIKGLEEVRDYHFTRPIKKLDPKSGKMIEEPKLCTEKISEINKARSLSLNVNANILLKSSTIDVFFQQPETAQRKIVVETRTIFDEIISKNAVLSRENDTLKTQNKALKADLSSLSSKIDSLSKEQEKMMKQIRYLMKTVDEKQRKEMLNQMGLSDYSCDLNVYMDSLNQKLSEIVNINDSLKRYLNSQVTEQSTDENFVEDIMSGINFDE